MSSNIHGFAFAFVFVPKSKSRAFNRHEGISKAYPGEHISISRPEISALSTRCSCSRRKGTIRQLLC